MKLYYTPGACSIGIHILLEEIGKPFEIENVDLKAGDQYRPPFTTLNPKSKVPVLERDDGSVLTEFPAIAVWLSRKNPEAKLLPTDPDAEARALEAMDYCVATIHMQGFGRMFRPGNFGPNAADEAAVQARGREILAKSFALMETALGDKPYLGGDAICVADAALFYVESWAGRFDVALPPHCAAHLARMKERPAVRRVFAAEGLA